MYNSLVNQLTGSSGKFMAQKASAFIQEFKTYYGWLGFTAFVFILTNILSTLDLIIVHMQRYDAAGLLLTLGFILLAGIAEMAPVAAALAGAHILLKNKSWKQIEPAAVLRVLVLGWFGISWLNLLAAIFKKTSF